MLNHIVRYLDKHHSGDHHGGHPTLLRYDEKNSQSGNSLNQNSGSVSASINRNASSGALGGRNLDSNYMLKKTNGLLSLEEVITYGEI
jgi:hypothetical protein